jgi:hypothetical protein
MPTHRPYAQLGIGQVERIVVDARDLGPINDAVLAELRHRTTPRAQRLQRFGDYHPERPNMGSETPLAVVIVDREGRPIPESCAVVSSFAWGLPIALGGDPALLREWEQVGTRIQDALHERLCRDRPQGKTMPLDRAGITAAYAWMVETPGPDRAIVDLPPSRCAAWCPFGRTRRQNRFC